jgi:subtilisin-like proprotein convertase family protein
VAALVIARNPALRWDEVKDILRRACDRIDPANGAYDANGFSQLYGYGRLNARRAVELAVPAVAGYVTLHRITRDVPIADLQTATLELQVGDSAPPTRVKVEVDLEHTYIGDLVVRVIPPVAAGVGPVTLHNRSGGGTDNLKQSFDVVNTPSLASLAGVTPQGTWRLQVEDQAQEDVGKIRSFTVELSY